MNRDDILDLFDDLADEVTDALVGLGDWGLSGQRPTQYNHDVVADAVLIPPLRAAGFSVLSEESGLVAGDDASAVTVVVDPVDGSTNASRGLPWFATSLCAVDGDGPVVALVANLATGERFRAVRGQGAETLGPRFARTVDPDPGRESDGTGSGGYRPVPGPSGCRRLADAIVGLSGLPPDGGGWAQYRALGAAALDLCAVAVGRLDGFIDTDSAHGVWDYLAAALICREAGAVVVDGQGRDLVVLDPDARRAPVAAATSELLGSLTALVDAETA